MITEPTNPTESVLLEILNVLLLEPVSEIFCQIVVLKSYALCDS